MLGFKKTYTFPFNYNIPNYITQFVNSKSKIKIWLKYAKRYSYIYIKNQKSLEIFNISDTHKNILWINFSAPSLGDSLMDLSSRILLNDRTIDLLTDKKNAHLFASDSIFSSIIEDKKKVNQNKYDLIIVDSFSTRSMKIKTEVAKSKPFVGMYGYFNGPEVNRVLFSFHQMNNLLGYIKNDKDINKIAKCLITISKEDQKIINGINLPDKFIAIILGGEWSYRTYNSWDKVIEKILKKSRAVNIVLLGSNNAKDYEKTILEKFNSINLTSYVGKFTFNQTAEIVRKSSLTICCDGGLMHAANSFEVQTIPLFARLEAKMQLTPISKAIPLFDSIDVNNIAVESILKNYEEAVNLDYIHPQNE